MLLLSNNADAIISLDGQSPESLTSNAESVKFFLDLREYLIFS
jgi:hypothetical protein